MLKFVLLTIAYSSILGLSLYFSFQFRFDFSPSPYLAKYWPSLAPLLILALPLLWFFGQFKSLLAFFGLPDVQRVVTALGLANIILLSVNMIGLPLETPPRAVTVLNFILGTGGIIAFRIGVRVLRERKEWAVIPAKARKRVAIYGAGDSGAALVSEFLARPNLRTSIVALFDDDPLKKLTQLHGIPILGGLSSLRKSFSDFAIEELILAIPSAESSKIREIMAQCRRLNLPVRTIPTVHHMVKGQMHLDRIKPVELEDLLARESIHIQKLGSAGWIAQRQVLVTGAGGTIGAELARQVWACHPRSLVLVDRSEPALFEIEQELRENGAGSEILAVVADIGDMDRMKNVFAQMTPDLIFHAAAHKHVPLMEHQVAEALSNNSLKTLRLAELACSIKAKDFIMISTDKAINPTNVMGVSKRLAELGLQLLQQKKSGMKITSVRFGNVLGSSGSVIPTFRRQIAAGGPVTITHPEVTRYFMSVAEAVDLVLCAGRIGTGGEIFVLDMGKPVKIESMARQLIEMSGFEPGREIEIKYTGLRPGEKLFEELSHSMEITEKTEDPKIWRLRPQCPPEVSFEELIKKIQVVIAESQVGNMAAAKSKIKEIVSEYQPWLG